MSALGKGRGCARINPPTLINMVMVNLLKTQVDLGGGGVPSVSVQSPCGTIDSDSIS